MDGRERILVGVDGSEGSDRALRWAARTAVARRASLQVIGVYADERTTVGVPMYGVVSGDTGADLRHATEQVVDEAARHVAELAPDLPTSACAVPGRPAAELAERARGATMIVVGSRELKAIGSAVLGSVSCRVVTKSEVPVIVVRGADTDAGVIDSSGRWRPAGAIVAGMDARSSGDAILRFAFEHASRVGIDLHLVTCGHLPEYVPEYWGPPSGSPDEGRNSAGRGPRRLAAGVSGRTGELFGDRRPCNRGVARGIRRAGLARGRRAHPSPGHRLPARIGEPGCASPRPLPGRRRPERASQRLSPVRIATAAG
jgi:nucleotide-binding universal stress UspA family protein